MDVIITESDEPYFVEFQHSFGEVYSLLEKDFKGLFTRYKNLEFLLTSQFGKNRVVERSLTQIGNDKERAYLEFPEFHPESIIFNGWNDELEEWSKNGESEFIIAKPTKIPEASCGKGIVVFDRKTFCKEKPVLKNGAIVQEYIESKKFLDDDDKPHFGCIRQVLMMVYDKEKLNFIHRCANWRIARNSFDGEARKGSLVANISCGGTGMLADEKDTEISTGLVESFCKKMVEKITGFEVSVGKSYLLTKNKEIEVIKGLLK